MNNFTKSILYSTTVLAVGLVAIFAIYDNVTQNQSTAVAEIASAAGESDFGIQFDAETGALTPEPQEIAEIAPAAGEETAEATHEHAEEEHATETDDAHTEGEDEAAHDHDEHDHSAEEGAAVEEKHAQ